MSDDFYVGYFSRAPRPTASFVARAVAALAVLVVAIALVLVFAQKPFAQSSFEYGRVRNFAGVVREHPVPHVELEDGGTALLVAPGKHTAAPMISGLEGRHAELSGSRIQRDGALMIEIQPGSIRAASPQAVGVRQWTFEGVAELRGEIVDTKCYLGVMNPGEGKVHRDCAARCISGGIPPALIAADAAGQRRLFVLTGPGGEPLNRQVLPFVGEPVVVRGMVFRAGRDWRIEVRTADLRRAE